MDSPLYIQILNFTAFVNALARMHKETQELQELQEKKELTRAGAGGHTVSVMACPCGALLAWRATEGALCCLNGHMFYAPRTLSRSVSATARVGRSHEHVCTVCNTQYVGNTAYCSDACASASRRTSALDRYYEKVRPARVEQRQTDERRCARPDCNNIIPDDKDYRTKYCSLECWPSTVIRRARVIAAVNAAVNAVP